MNSIVSRTWAILFVSLLVGGSLFVSGCSVLSCGQSDSRETLTQFSVIDALLKGVYDGEMTCGELRRYGDLGIGTFNGLDGELLVVDRVVYRVGFDGSVTRVSKSEEIPFAAVTWFDADLEFDIADKSYGEFKDYISKKLPSENWFYAIRAHGRFSYMKTRSVPRQTKPYPALSEVVKGQAVFEEDNIEGTLVGFWSPAFVKGVNVPGYHVHFLSADHLMGGHVLDFEMSYGVVELDVTTDIEVILPEEGDFLDTDLTKDLSKDLHKVETDKK